MKPWIKTSLVVAALSASTVFGGVAMAAHGHGEHDGKWGGQGWHATSPEQVKERLTRQTELRLAKLELALALTAEQKPAWADFKTAITAGAETVLKEVESRQKADAPRTVLERLDRAEAALKVRANLLADARKAVGAFYPKLSEAQKTVFDAEAGKFLHAGHPGSPDGHAGKGGEGRKQTRR
ncbi:hypothetical protein AGMMS49960_15970 [Betaproteobacteria bacterium]|nr:hypothetical protein AGMMS49543_25260 [Betaproteobacteria bacterium]GHU02814.1 hypothetical protein AGMMS49960_15970 [Betaproteobacteria bacterium]GHU19248.1 hypothetical protein AGMMS50243_10850 [Betaproteobacteria bacterium]